MKQYIETRIIERAYSYLNKMPNNTYTQEPPNKLIDSLGLNYVGFKQQVLRIALFPKDKTEKLFSWYLLLFKSNLLESYYKEVVSTDDAFDSMFVYSDPFALSNVQGFLLDLKSCMRLYSFNHYETPYYSLDIPYQFFDKYRLVDKGGLKFIDSRFHEVSLRNVYRNSIYGKQIKSLNYKLGQINKLISNKEFYFVVSKLTNDGTSFRKEIRKIRPILRLYVEIVDHVHSLYKNRKF